MSNAEVDTIVRNVRKHFDHDAAKQLLKEKYEAKMLFAAFGGMWKAGPALITVTDEKNYMPEELVLVDEYGNPCKVDVKELNQLAMERWQEQMNAWHHEFQELQNKR